MKRITLEKISIIANIAFIIISVFVLCANSFIIGAMNNTAAAILIIGCAAFVVVTFFAWLLILISYLFDGGSK